MAYTESMIQQWLRISKEKTLQVVSICNVTYWIKILGRSWRVILTEQSRQLSNYTVWLKNICGSLK